MIEIILASFVIMLASLVAVVSVWRRLGRIIENNLGFLVSLAAGVFMVVAYQLSVEAVEHAASPAWGILWVVVGILIWGLVFKLIPSFHRHHDTVEDHRQSGEIDIRRVIAGDAIHNTGDGILLTSAFMINPALGLATTISIFVHELVQETAEFFVLRRAGLSISLALLINFLVSGFILIGAVASWFLFESFIALEAPLLGLAGGAFLMVALMDLIPHSIKASSDKMDIFKHIAWFSVGLILILTVNLFTVHSHEIDDGHSHGLDDDHSHQEIEVDHGPDEGHHHDEDDHHDEVGH